MSEVLRCAFIDPDEGRVVCSAGADGKAIIWGALDDNSIEKFKKLCTLNHGESQIYSCELLEHFTNAQLLTAAENEVHLWNLSDISGSESWTFDAVYPRTSKPIVPNTYSTPGKHM